ncbi:hypothetical protein ACH5RR_018711 [Cinchona calisaya]|uniref:Uncharacterized protein n=1 Tax=Cinchona calisaya TaxID=153742 RepID=A0ABD2ZQX2_9GENT
MTSSIEIEDKDVTKEFEILAKPTKDNGSSVEFDLSSLESIIHRLFKLLQEVRRLLVDVLQECDGKYSTFEESISKSSCPKVNCATITFTDEDLLLGSISYNRPLFISGSNHSRK